MEFSPNFIVIKSNEETFVLNGQQRDDKPVLIDIGGTTLLYTLEGSGRNLVKKLRGQGPIKNSIQIYMMAKEEVNPGVTYEFYIPRTGREALYIPTESLVNPIQTLEQRQAELRSGDIGESSYFWNYGGWTPCSAICGNGFRKRLVLCMNRLTGKRAELENCVASDRPADSEQCKGEDCDSTSEDSTVEWELGDWGPCSSSCDIGDQLHDVTCVSTDPSGRTVTVDDQKCIQLYGRKPEYRRSCNENIPCPYWTPVEEWSSCNKDCGMGEQSRAVLCVSIDNRRLADSACDSTKKPASTRPCMVRQCDSNPEDPGLNCRNSPFGCCQDGRTAAQGSNFEGCPQECTSSRYGCCPDQKTPARGPDGEGCPPECLQSRYGCCQDQKTPARGPNEEGCPSDCSRTRFGCCSDNQTPARGPNGEGCTVHCSRYRYGCCPDNVTIARGSNGEGCPVSCSGSTYGCCPDGRTVKTGPDNEGCSLECSRYRYGCCPDNLTPARGPNGEGCPNVCTTSRYGCCEDGRTEARGPNGEGCPADCSRRRYGCCPDNVTPARGPDGEGCPNACSTSLYGCCPDRKTAARGPNREGCPADCNRYRYGCCADNVTPARGENGEGCPSNCTMSQYGCCPDRLTEAKGFNFEGCSNQCLRSRYGCCPDGRTEARGPNNDGCFYVDCSRYQFGCCSDNVTIARGPDGEGCPSNCTLSVYGCCADQVTEAQGYNMEGCPSECLRSRYGCCSDGIREARGPNAEGCAVSCVDMQFGCCPDNQTPARGPNSQGCYIDCSRYQYGCCSDELTPARGPRGEGCPSNCTLSQYGCCPDQVTEAKGYNNEGCFRDCRTSRYGCCQDGRTEARGPNGEGCVLDCVRQRFGCCPDSNTPARGPDGEGCPSDCTKSLYGCCYDGTTSASGPDGIGCPPDCLRYRYGCCSDNVTIARGPNGEGCPSNCTFSQYGCCLDEVTSARGFNFEGCPPECLNSRYGCCLDNRTEARGPNGEGCPNDCSRTRYGCCPDKKTPARGSGGEGCPPECLQSRYGCCQDQRTPARGPNKEGCPSDCSRSRYGCCPDQKTPARGPNREGCTVHCSRYRYGCCPDNVTISRGPNSEGCPTSCSDSTYGCCPDGRTVKRGPNGEGCVYECSKTRYGCCLDNQTPARGPNQEGCPSKCRNSIYGCCSDGVTQARGLNGEGCVFDCERRTYGCCADNRTPARGPNGEGCPRVCELSRFGCCPYSNISATGPNYSGCPYTCLTSIYGCCSDNYTAARGPNQEGCLKTCEISRFGCCPFSNISATGPNYSGCPYTCFTSIYGCCSDNYTAARGPNQKGCLKTCEISRFGCCPFGNISATGPNYSGCPYTCLTGVYGCCPDNYTAARGPDGEGCPSPCDQYPYGCCQDGKTPANGPGQEGCLPGITQSDSCGLKPERGPCTNYSVLYFYNSTAKRCQRFWYGGCDGNDNRFNTEDECKEKCSGSRTENTDRRPVTAKQTCQNSYYGCCPDGVTFARGSNYEGCTQSEDRPVCQQPSDSGRDCEGAKLEIRWYYKTDLQRCDRFWFRGCGGNNNNFKTEEECQQTCTGGGGRPDMIRNLHVHHATSDAIMVTWEPPQNNDVESYKVAYLGTKYYRDTVKQDPMKEIVLTSDSRSYTISNLMEGADYMINVYPQFNGRGVGPKSSIMGKTKTWLLCDDSRYGCCPDGITAASGQNYAGCADEDPCKKSTWGCCEDGISEATGPNFEGCDLDGRPSGDFCNETVYGCCPDGETPAQGANYDGCPREPEITPVGICQKKEERGPCSDFEVKWFYNTTSQRCDRFWYGGCEGNDNRFDDEEACSRRCKQTTPDTGSKPVCEQPKVTGPCRAYFKKYYFNGRECEEFIYGGCQGNENNFETIEQCEETCEIDIDNTRGQETCQQPMDTGPCRGNIPRWYFDRQSNQCLEFLYGGCQGNTNNFETREECQKSCASGTGQPDRQDQDVCKLNSDTGPCRALVMRWYYDYNDGVCRNFSYGGCDGNQNNFETQQACESTCSRDHVCKPFITGQIQCLAYQRRYKYDATSGDCMQFIYGGCGGNSNNFGSVEACRRKCVPERPRPAVTTESPIEGSGDGGEGYCHLQVDQGSCKALIPAWYYDHLTGQCSQFQYGGCGGNENRFTSQEVCESSCSRENVCNMEKEEGNCLAYFQNYFYNKKTQSCEGFIYGGCGGNANNFDSLDSCNRKCIQRECSNQDFRCRSGQCVDVRRRCDGVPDCTDRSDEDSTMCAPVTTCPEGYFRCADRSCVDGRRCDGRQDCADNSDEYQCVVNTTCPQGYFRCADRSCVAGRRCDGRQDCADNSDEYQCAVQNPPTDVDVTPSRDDNYQVILRWRAPASSGLNPVLDYKILYTNRGPNADESQWYTQQAEGNQEYMYVSGLQPDSTYYFKIQARNAGGYGPFSRAVVYIAPSRVTDAPRGKDPNCMLPVDRGSCSNMTIMYHYDPSISDCRPFRWYGCTGNANRFSSGQECRSRCWDRYNVIPTRGPVYPTERPRVTSRPTYPTERPPVTTRRPIYPTEGPRVTTTREYTVNVDLCDEKDERGPCSNYSVKWYYNKTEQKCRRFWYGGCEGNANRFDDEQECQDVCINRVRPNPGTPATTKAPDDKDNEIDDKTCGSRFGCCPDGITPARDFYLSNCNDETGPDTEVIQGDYTSLIKEPDTDVVIQCNRYQTGYGSISWYKDGFQLAQTGRVFIQSDGSLLIRMATVDDSGMYACRIASVGSTPEIERFRLQVEVPITIFPTPAKIVVQPGMNAFLHCQAYGNPRPRVAWSRDGYDVSRDPRFSVYPNGTLIIQRTLEQDMGSYLCVANNGVSNPAQRIVMLQLRESLRASIEQVEERKREGETLYLTCSGFGYPTPSITWEKNGLPLTSDQRIKIQGGSLRVINLALEDTGTYTCIVMNDEEKVEDTVSIQVTPFDLLPSTCVDSASKVKCSLIVAARLCGHTRYSRPCCESCQREKTRIMQQSSTILG